MAAVMSLALAHMNRYQALTDNRLYLLSFTDMRLDWFTVCSQPHSQ
jgi:hypothetical protein